MKKIIDGELIEMTPEEIAEFERMAAEAEDHKASEPTDHDRIAALEEQLAAAKILLGVSE